MASFHRPFPRIRPDLWRPPLRALLERAREPIATFHWRAHARLWRRRVTLAAVLWEPWRFLVGGSTVIIPLLAMRLAMPGLPLSTPGLVLLFAVALSTYLADWVGGLSALVLGLAMLDAMFVGVRAFLALPADGTEAFGLGVTLGAGLALIWLIERVKRQSTEDRRAAIAARSAATALASLETVAAATAPGDESERRQLFDAVARALAGVYRAHASALYLVDRPGRAPIPAATYGFPRALSQSEPLTDMRDEIARLAILGRRPLVFDDVERDSRLADFRPDGSPVRSILAAPMIGRDDRPLGAIMIGLLVRHQFSATEIAKIGALARQAAVIVETATVVDERESLLMRAREEQRRLELVIAAMPEAVVLAAPPDGRIVAANDAAIALFGPLQDVDLRERIVWTGGEDDNPAELPLRHTLQTGEVAAGVELIARRPDGEETPVLASAAPVREPDGSISAVVAVFRDIGALKQANRIKDEFVSIVSHELRSPLTPIRGFVQLVAKDLDREGGHDSHVMRLKSIAGHVDRMTRLVDDLLDVSRLKAGSLDIQREPVDLVALAREVIQGRAVAASGHRLRFEPRIPALIGDWDPDRLQQVIDNLIGNAIKYSPAGGIVHISIGSDQTAGDAWLMVSDDGPGIPVEDRERVFGAFYRSRSAAASQVTGLGLGLYICHELVLAHGGAIEAGASPSGGASFTVRLPREVQSLAA